MHGLLCIHTVDLYAASLLQIAWAETIGYDDVWLTEHHFCDDGYTPYNGACPMCIKQIGLLRQMRSLQENPRSPSHRSTP